MSWDLEQEKAKAFRFVEKSYEQEKKGIKKKKVQQTIDLAKEELDELHEAFGQFLGKVNHLVVYQEMFKEALQTMMQQMTDNSRYFLEKNYTKEEISEMPDDVYRQVAHSQERRKEILKKIASRYNL